MPKVGVNLFSFDLDKGGFTKTLDAAIQTQMRQAAKAFLNVAVRKIPVQTGFVQGAFRNLMSAAGAGQGVNSPAKQFLRASQAVDHMRYHDGGGVIKNPTSGQQFATPSSEIFTAVGFKYSFNFDVFITYFNINDVNVNPRNQGTPWNAMSSGMTEFSNYMATQGLQKLPKVGSFLLRATHTVNGESATKTSYIRRE